MRTLKIGDVVALKSGGPDLTVVQVTGFASDPQIVVTWIGENGTLQTAQFSQAVLDLRVEQPDVDVNFGLNKLKEN